MFIPDSINLLYIEDDKKNADIILAFLELSKVIKFNITHKITLEEGLNYITENCSGYIDSCDLTQKNSCQIDVILLDLVLPNSQGVDTYTSVLKRCPCIPIVIISPHEEMACECVKLGAQDYLVKPHVNPGLIIRAIKYAIERTKLENERLRIEKKFREVIHSIPIGLHNYELKGDDLIFVGSNPAADRILKIKHDKLMGKKIEEAFPSLSNTDIPDRYKEIAKIGEPWNAGIIEYEDTNIKRSFFKIHVFRTYPGLVTASFEDVTDQITARQKLEISEKRFRSLVEITGAAIYEIDISCENFIYINDIVCRQTGYTKEEIFKLGPSGLLSKQSFIEWIKRWENLPTNNDEPFEYEIIRKDGSSLWVLIVAEFKKDQKGNLLKANIVAIDITKQKSTEIKLQKKEDTIFNELENKIHQWRNEITERSSVKIEKLNVMDKQIQSIGDTDEVSQCQKT